MTPFTIHLHEPTSNETELSIAPDDAPLPLVTSPSQLPDTPSEHELRALGVAIAMDPDLALASLGLVARTGRVPPNALRTPHRAAVARALLASGARFPVNDLLRELRDLPLRPSELAEVTRELPPIGPLPRESDEDPSELPPLTPEEGSALVDASLLRRAWIDSLQRWPHELEHAPREVLSSLASEAWPEPEIEVVLHGEREARRRSLAPETRARMWRQEREEQAFAGGGEADDEAVGARVRSRLMDTAERLAPFVPADERQRYLADAAAHAGSDPSELTAEQLRDVAAWSGLARRRVDPMARGLTDDVIFRGMGQLLLDPPSLGAGAKLQPRSLAKALLWLHRVAPWQARELDARIRAVADHPARAVAELCARYADEASLERALAPLGWPIVGGFGNPVAHLRERLGAVGVTASVQFLRDEACDVDRALHDIASTSPTLRAYVFAATKSPDTWGCERLRAHGPEGAFRSNDLDIGVVCGPILCTFLNAILSRVGAPERIWVLDGPATDASDGFASSFDGWTESYIALRPDEIALLRELGLVDRRS